MPSERCEVTKTHTNNGHPVVYGCVLAPHKKGPHQWKTLIRILHEESTGLPISSRMIFRPIDGNWLSKDLSNWRIMTRKEMRKEDSNRNKGATKECKTCGETLPLDDFAPRRNHCKECWKARLRNNTKKYKNHVEEIGCTVIDGIHYHIGALGSGENPIVIYSWFARLIAEMRDTSSSPVEYRRRHHRLVRKIRNALK